MKIDTTHLYRKDLEPQEVACGKPLANGIDISVRPELVDCPVCLAQLKREREEKEIP